MGSKEFFFLISGDCWSLPAEGFSHACVLDVLVRGEAPDEHRDHLHGDMLHQTGESNRWIERRVCNSKEMYNSFLVK